jgi:hypothetical protein
MAALGLDPLKFLETRSTLERALLIELHNRTLKVKQTMDHNLAVEIANQVGRLFKK